jgi:hypothetical protein
MSIFNRYKDKNKYRNTFKKYYLKLFTHFLRLEFFNINYDLKFEILFTFAAG